MIIWRGWGILAFLYFGATVAVGVGIPAAISGDTSMTWPVILAGLVFGAASWFHGRHLNVVKPQEELQDFALLREEVMESVRIGAFRLPDNPPPTSLEQATGQAEAYLQMIHGSLSNARNRHTLFFIPFQYLGFFIALWPIAMSFLAK